jgi:hypothetical protein
MSSFEVTITLKSSLSSQELADFFVALAKSEQGDVQPLVRILHPVEPPPPPTPLEPTQPVKQPETPPTTEPVPSPKNTQWERCDIKLVDETTMEAIVQSINTGEFISPAPSISWQGIKHSPRSQHNQRIFTTLRATPNRTLSFTSLGAQAGLPEKEKLKSYLREMEKQGLITATRRPL